MYRIRILLLSSYLMVERDRAFGMAGVMKAEAPKSKLETVIARNIVKGKILWVGLTKRLGKVSTSISG